MGSNFGELLPSLPPGGPRHPCARLFPQPAPASPTPGGPSLARTGTPPAPQPPPGFSQVPLAPPQPTHLDAGALLTRGPHDTPPAVAAPALRPAPCRPRHGVSHAPPLPRRAPPQPAPRPHPKAPVTHPCPRQGWTLERGLSSHRDGAMATRVPWAGPLATAFPKFLFCFKGKIANK